MAEWTVGIEITGSRIDGEGLARLVDVFEHEFPDYEADCALWSGWLGIHALVRSPTPPEALEAALNAIDFAFNEAGIDIERTADVVNVTMRRVLRPVPVPDRDSLPRALLERVSPPRRRGGPSQRDRTSAS